jgi:hypothetical protein
MDSSLAIINRSHNMKQVQASVIPKVLVSDLLVKFDSVTIHLK